jgi:hypothetical protein
VVVQFLALASLTARCMRVLSMIEHTNAAQSDINFRFFTISGSNNVTTARASR